MTTGLRIGELAKRTNCQIETIRYYEREGLLHAPERTDDDLDAVLAAVRAKTRGSGLEIIAAHEQLEVTLGEGQP